MGGALVKLDHSLARVKIWGRSTFYGPKYGLSKNVFSVGTIHQPDLQGYRTKLYRTCFFQRGRNRCQTSNSPIFNIFIRSGDIRRRTLKSTEIWPNFAFFRPLNFFLVGFPKILDRYYKLKALSSIVQNFAPIGRRSSEITRGEKERKKA